MNVLSVNVFMCFCLFDAAVQIIDFRYILHFCVCLCMSQCLSVRDCESQPLSLFLRRLKSFADRHSQLCSSRRIQNPSTFLAKSFIVGRTDRSEDEEGEEEKRGLKGGERREVPLRKDRGTVWGRRVRSSPVPNW